MASNIDNKNDLKLNNKIEDKSSTMSAPESSPIDPQVKVKKYNAARRTYDIAYKMRILSAYDNCENALDRGALLRKEGLYHSRINAWKHQSKNDKLNIKKSKNCTLKMDNLLLENERLKKKLAQAEAIIDLQKKISELLGTHILPAEIGESKL